MVTEKIAAYAEAQVAAATAVMEGKGARQVTKKVLGVYKRRIHRNQLRLTK